MSGSLFMSILAGQAGVYPARAIEEDGRHIEVFFGRNPPT